MKKTELITACIAILALAMQLFLLPGSGVLTVLSLSLLAMIYFYGSFALLNDIRGRKIFKKDSYTGLSALRITGTIATGFAFSTIIIGIMFFVQSWPGAVPNTVVGLAALLIVLVVAGIRYAKSGSPFYTGIFKRAAIIGALGLLVITLPRGAWVELKYRNYPDYANAFKQAIADPGNQQLWDKVDAEREKMYREE